MTIQKRTLIAPSDIVAIEYICGHCESRFSVPLGKSDRPLMNCPNCHEAWFRPSNKVAGNQTHEVVRNLQISLAELQSRQMDGVEVRLEIRGETI